MQHYVTDEKYLRKNRKEPPGKNFITIILIALVINLLYIFPVSYLTEAGGSLQTHTFPSLGLSF